MKDQTLFFEDQQGWESWLEANHRQKESIRLLIYKKHSGATSLSYDEALESALCYGWIDGKVNRIDESKHTILFSPRRKNSIWSKKNRTQALSLLKEDRIKPFGIEKINEAKASGRWEESLIDEDALPERLRAAQEENPSAKAFYDTLPDSAKKHYHWWVIEAKREETQKKRVDKSIEKLSKKLRLWDPEDLVASDR